jgi:hypothetical protein
VLGGSNLPPLPLIHGIEALTSGKQDWETGNWWRVYVYGVPFIGNKFLNSDFSCGCTTLWIF